MRLYPEIKNTSILAERLKRQPLKEELLKSLKSAKTVTVLKKIRETHSHFQQDESEKA